MILKTCILTLGFAFCLSSSATTLRAQVILGDAEDTAVASNTAGNQGGGTFSFLSPTANQIRVGRFNPSTGNINTASVFAFVLPDLGSIANPFETANLQFNLNRTGRNFSTDLPTFNADLYGIDRRAMPDVIAADDFFFGPTTELVSDPDATFLQQDILTPDDVTALIAAGSPISITSEDIASYLNTQYESGAGIGEAVFLRLNADAIPLIPTANTTATPFRDGYVVGAAESGAGGPVINFTATTAVPEPTSALVLFLGATAISSRRRRNR